MRTTRLAAIIAAGMAVTLAAACTSPSATDDGDSDGPLTLYSDNAYWEEAFITVGDTLAETTGRGLDPRAIPLTTNYEQQVRTALPTSSITDLIKWWSGYRLQDIARDGLLADLTDVWDEAEENGWVDPQLRSAYEYDGRVYGLPAYHSDWVVFYSKPLYEQYGLEVPATFEQFEANELVKISVYVIGPSWLFSVTGRG